MNGVQCTKHRRTAGDEDVSHDQVIEQRQSVQPLCAKDNGGYGMSQADGDQRRGRCNRVSQPQSPRKILGQFLAVFLQSGEKWKVESLQRHQSDNGIGCQGVGPSDVANIGHAEIHTHKYWRDRVLDGRDDVSSLQCQAKVDVLSD